MTPTDLQQLSSIVHIPESTLLIGMLVLMVWSLYWKWRSLWTAAEHGDKVWFTVLLIINSVGILDLVYIYLLAKPGDPEYSTEESKTDLG